jgi:CTP:molybdopterin cytidylyltransferase MocA
VRDALTERASLVLNAGQSTRMGSCKGALPCLHSDGRRISFLERAIALARAGCPEGKVVVVCAEETIPTGTDGDGEYLAHANVVLAINHQPGLGMFSSVQTGFRKVKEVHDHPVSTLLLLVDHPLVSESTVHALWDAHALAPHAFIVPTYRGQAGHPIVVPAQAMSLILDSPCSSRLDGLMAKHDRIMVDVPDAGVVTDLNTPEAYCRVFWQASS